MPRRRQDLLGKLADPFEEALQKLSSMPGTQTFVKAASGMRDRVDDLSKRIGRLDDLEKRVRELEKRVNQMSGGRSTTRARGAATKRTTASRAKPTTRKTTRSRSAGTTRSSGTRRSSGGSTRRRRPS